MTKVTHDIAIIFVNYYNFVLNFNYKYYCRQNKNRLNLHLTRLIHLSQHAWQNCRRAERKSAALQDLIWKIQYKNWNKYLPKFPFILYIFDYRVKMKCTLWQQTLSTRKIVNQCIYRMSYGNEKYFVLALQMTKQITWIHVW